MINFINKLFRQGSYTSSSVYLILGSTLTAVVFLCIDIVLSRTVSVTQMGEWKQLILLVQLFIPIFYFGIPEGFKYLLAKNPNRQHYLFLNALSITLLFTVVIFILNLLGFWNWILVLMGNTNSRESLLVFPAIYFAIMIYMLMQYISINNFKTRIFFIAVIAASLFQLAIIGVLYFMFQDSAYLQSMINWIFVTLILGNYLIRAVVLGFEIPFSFGNFRIRKQVLFQMLSFGIPLYLASYVGVLTLNIDKLIVSKMGGTEQFAVYAIGAFEVPLIGIISVAFAKTLFPKAVEFIQEGSAHKAKKLWMDTTIKLSYITYPIIIVLLLISKPFILLLFGENYEGAIPIFRTYLLLLIWRNNAYGLMIQAKGETKWITLYTVIAFLINGILSYVFYIQIGLIGVVYATFLSLMISNLLKLLHEHMLLDYFKRVILNRYIAFMLVIIFGLYYALEFVL